jgi:DNA-binding response OmpR family regulator
VLNLAPEYKRLPEFARSSKYNTKMNNIKKTITILIVEDEPRLLERLVRYVSIFCDTVYQATNGYEALEVYKKHSPNIILTDINMPKLTGVEFIQEVRKRDEKCQIIILSAHTDTEDLLKVLPCKLVSYLVKPIKMEELKSSLLKAIDKVSDNIQINLNNGYKWNTNTKSLFYNDILIPLSSYEVAFVDCLVSNLNESISYEDIHYYIYSFDEYSQDAIFTIAKRIRKKTKKEFIQSSFKFGYRIESNY